MCSTWSSQCAVCSTKHGVQRNAIKHVLNHGAEHCVLSAGLGRLVQLFGQVQGGPGHLVVGVGRIGHQILVVGVLHKYLSACHLDWIVGKVVDHGLGLLALFELQKSLAL
ncbi:hypothetical protein BpHYR1_004641 [Brachionus plicatilis]|uniref:Uncharacterized protein n=1 Tax=Brachionus plicatilis TaxID=10195 RepID=A0A3M7S803_BRAPC|nr:hypothetical protein BpHYR1_004641 [Brachionus plicatilis]